MEPKILARFSSLTEEFLDRSCSTGIIILQANLCIIYCNQAFVRMLGLINSPVGNNLSQYVTDETLAGLVFPAKNETLQNLWNFKADGFFLKAQCTIQAQEDNYIVFVENHRLSDHEIIATLNSLNLEMANHSREVEKRRREMERTNQALQSEIKDMIVRAERLTALAAFAAGITHEITQPVNAIKVAADSMLYLHQKGLELTFSEVVSDMEVVSEQTNRINKIIMHLKALANKQDKEYSSCDLNRCISEVLRFVSRDIDTAGIVIQCELAAIKPIWANETAIEELVMNLITNSIRALRRVEKKDKIITIRTYTAYGQVHLEVADNGPGIEPSLEKNVFEPFFTTTLKGEGIGLGLPIVSSIVEAHDAKMEVRNQFSHGVTFNIAFREMTGL